MKMKRMAAAMLAAMMTVSLAACGQSGDNTKEASKKQTKETTKTTERPEAVPEEDWEAMQKEPAFGTELNYLFNGGACVSAKYLAEELGYYEEYGINATYVSGRVCCGDRWNRAMYVGDRPHCDYARAGYKRCQNDIRMRRAYWV